MPAVSELLVRIDATTEGLRRELQRADQQLGGFAKNTDKSLAGVDRSFKNVDRNVTTLGQRFQNFNAMLGTLGVGMGAMQAGKWILQQADAYVQLENKLKVVTASQSQLEGVMGGLFASAQRYSIELSSQVDLYSRLAGALEHTGISQEELLKLTDTFAAALKAGGATTAEASQAITQLTQAFRGGKLQAEEMNTLLDTMPDYMNAVIAEVARVNGVSLDEARAKIKDFGAEGKITLDVLVAAAQNMRDGVVGKTNEMADTTANAMTRLRNSLTMTGEAFGPIIPVVTRFFEDLAAGATKSAAQIKAFTDAVQRGIAIVKEFLGVSDLTDFEGIAKGIGVNVGAIQTETNRFKQAAQEFKATAAETTARVAPAPAGRPMVDTSVMMREWSAFTKALGYQHGGAVSGAGGIDNIPAWLTAGEFVVNPEASRKHRALLEAMNDNKFATGGVVGNAATTTVQPAIDGLARDVGGTFTSIADRWREAAQRVDAQRAEAQRRMEAEDKALASKAEEDRKARAAAYKPAAAAIDSGKKRTTARATTARATTDKASAEIDRDAERVIDSTRSALERYNAEVDRLSKLHSAGKINQDVFNRGIAAAKQELNAEPIAEAGRIFESTRTSAERYEATMARLRELHEGGFIDSDTFGRAATQALKDMEAAANDLYASFTNVDAMAENLGWTMAQSFEDAVFEGGKLRAVLKGLWEDIQRIVFRQLVTVPLASGITAILGGAMAGVPGMPMYQHGGEVKGPGGVDNVPSLLTAGEFVVNAQSARRHRAMLEAINDNRLGSMTGIPRFAAGGFVGPASHAGGTGQIEITLENKSATPLRLEGAQQRKGPDGKAMISVMVTDAVKAAMDAGQFDRNMSSRYGASVQPIGR